MSIEANSANHQQTNNSAYIQTKSSAVANTNQQPRPYWPYWFIHGKLYDLSSWLEQHPGGADFLKRSQGTDCTAAFEVHHIRMPKALAMLKRFEVEQQQEPPQSPIPESPWPQFDWSQYDKLRKGVAKRLKEQKWQPGPCKRAKTIAIATLAINLTIPFIWQFAGIFTPLLAVVYAMNMIIMTGFGHMFLHLNTKWQYLGDLGGFSSHTWKEEHCLAHHLYTNHPTFDPDVSRLFPLVHFSPEFRTQWQKFALLFMVPLYSIAFMVLRLTRPVEIIRDPQNWQIRLAWYVVGSFGWLALWWAVGYFWIGILLECLASFLFLSLTLSNHNHDSCHEFNKNQDFVAHQIDGCYDFGSVNYWSSMTLSAFLGSQTIHHLFPTLNPLYFNVVIEELRAMGIEYKRRSFWHSYLDHLKFMMGKETRHGA